MSDPLRVGLITGTIGLALAISSIDMNKTGKLPDWIFDVSLMLIWAACGLFTFCVGYSVTWLFNRSSPPGS